MSTFTLPARRIGNDHVTAIGFGAMGIGNFGYGSELNQDDETRFKVLDRLLELGCTNWDTADVYNDSEDLIGKWFKRTGKRDQIFLATKFAVTPDGPRGDPEYVKASIEKSLKRLGVDTIDLYYVHRIDPNVPIETTMAALVELVKYLNPCLLFVYSPFVLDIEQQGHLLETARELGVAVVAYSPLGKGLITGQIKSHADLPEGDLRKIIPKYQDENFSKVLSLVEKLQKIGAKHNATAGQVTLAYLLAQGDDIIPIPGDDKPPLYALIIGINDYPKIAGLKGAVRDAESFRDYLIKQLAVPEAQIVALLNKQATRDNIIGAIRALGTNSKIKPQDPIVIFYAGHGTMLDKPEGWEAGESQIQALVPYDIKAEDASRNPIVPIPDRTIAALLNEIAQTKGDNITVIFDCCHSASGTPDVDSDILYNVPKSETRHAVVAKGFANQELRSHVLLAACGSEELAYESDGLGDFTVGLLKTLKQYGADKTTYKGCIERLPALLKQNPVCEGFHKDRIFFNAKVAGANPKLILIEKEGNTCILRAGIAQNINVGAIFKVFKDDLANPAKDAPLGSMRVVAAESTRSTLNWESNAKPFNLPELSYGFQTHCGLDQFLKVHFTPRLQARLPPDNKWLSAFSATQTNIVIKPCDPGSADLIVDLDKRNDAVFDIRHALISRYGVKELPKSVPVTAEDILAVLRASALWIWHLNRNNPESSLEQSIRVEFKRLSQNPRPRPREPTGDDLNKGGVVDIIANPQDKFCMKLVNNSPYDLYANLFYFDVNGQSIEGWNTSMVGKKRIDAPLLKRSFLPLGYGAGGGSPLGFELDADKELELGILKLYVTNQPGEFSSIEQPSPFTFDKTGKRANVKSTDVTSSLTMRGVWHTVNLVLIQRKFRATK
ncbi:hypothetical protein FRC07_013748 [Ceratobasidium sp. 392]|nr:hypothetical protein FRC07_013748 [Ceratobasidium sp. 392]